ncbi:unnamed protein product, partial [Prorocentrum cordatum]
SPRPLPRPPSPRGERHRAADPPQVRGDAGERTAPRGALSARGKLGRLGRREAVARRRSNARRSWRRRRRKRRRRRMAPAKRSALEGRGLERQPPCSQGARQPGSAVGEDTRGGGGGEGGGKKGGGGGGGGAPGLRQARDTSRPYPSHFPPRSPPKLAWDTHRLGRRQLTNTSSGGKPSQRHISTSLIAEGLTAGRSRGGVLGLKMLHY